MKLKKIADIQITKANWNKTLSITASEEFLAWHSEKYGWFVSSQKELFLPFFIKRHLFINRLTFLDDVDSLFKGKNVSIEDKLHFLNNCIKYIKEHLDVDFITQSPAYAIFETSPSDSISAPFGSYRIDLSKSEDEIWGNIHSKHKNVIRKAIQNNVDIKSGHQYLNQSIQLINETLERSKIKSLDIKKINQLTQNLNGNIVPYICEHNGILQGTAIFIFSQKSALYMWGGSISDPTTGAMNYLHWAAIKDFKTLNVECYDFVGGRIKPEAGSKLEGIQRFKSRFGGYFYQGYLWKYPITWKYYIYIVILKAYFFFKGRNTKDIIDQELKLQAK